MNLQGNQAQGLREEGSLTNLLIFMIGEEGRSGRGRGCSTALKYGDVVWVSLAFEDTGILVLLKTLVICLILIYLSTGLVI